MTIQRQGLGCRGEELACAFLREKGYLILNRNYRTKTAELDIVAREGEYLVFVEVKSRSSNEFGSPFEAITRRKQSKMILAAQEYLARERPASRAARFDVVSVLFERGKPVIDHLENAFELS